MARTIPSAAIVGLLAALLLAAGPATADEPMDPFLGTYVGTAEVYDSDGRVVERRHMDIVITEGQRGAYEIDWVNVTLVDDRRDLPGVRRRVDHLTLTPGDQEGLYLEESRRSLFERRRSADPMEGDALRWARLAEGRLGVFSLVILDDGAYSLQSYERILTEHGMDIEFQRIQDGEVTRRIAGRTIRVE